MIPRNRFIAFSNLFCEKRSLFFENNRSNPWPEFCPYATCINSPVCQPCNRRFIFELSLGRAGSTSLMEVINMLPNVRISGENENVIEKLRFVVDKLNKKRILNPREGAFWRNSIPEGAFACPVQKFVETLDLPKMTDLQDDGETIMGFKTIRFLNPQNGSYYCDTCPSDVDRDLVLERVAFMRK